MLIKRENDLNGFLVAVGPDLFNNYITSSKDNIEEEIDQILRDRTLSEQKEKENDETSDLIDISENQPPYNLILLIWFQGMM